LKVRVICKQCGKSIYLNISNENLNEAKGGIFRVAAKHNCNGKPKAVLAFVDSDLSVRGQEICPMVESNED
jgi:hypothetical protein